MSSSREVKIIILGATGYTASICAEHITKTFPTTLKWAIAGRSTSALKDLSERLRIINSDRLQPAIEVVNLEGSELTHVVRKTRVIINGIGPYHRFSTPIVEACARSGTHYVDFSTETP